MLLRVQNVRARYNGILAIDSVSIDVPEKSVVALLGANGAGKSTLLKTISGLLPNTAGSIWFDGERIDGQAPIRIFRRGIAQVPEGRRLFADMSVVENLLIGGNRLNDKKELNRRIEEAFRYFPILKERKNQKSGTMSGGEQQMVAIARALVANPLLMILDEPSLGLAPIVINMLFDVIKRISDDGISILIAEQNAAKALKVADIAYVLESGKIKLCGAAEMIRENEEVRRMYLGI